MVSILIVEDDITFSLMLTTWLGKKGFSVSSSSTVADAKRKLEGETVDLVLSDLRLPDSDGIDLLRWLKKAFPSVPLIMMTSYAEIQTAVQAMKLGAADYIAKPLNPEDLLGKIRELIAVEEAPVSPMPATSTSDLYIEGQSQAARLLYEHVRLVAPTDMSVLVTGASGTGKEYIARRIHEQSSRSKAPFIAVDCGAIPKELAASEFFGHMKGSFTGAIDNKTGAFVAAQGGTIFLDEIGNLTYEVQVQLLRALQERHIRPIGSTKEIEVDVRLICATNENLPKAIANGQFREDLYHRLNEFTLHMPLLKDRGEDILLFADFFLQQANRELEKDIIGFDPYVSQSIMNYSWPGNLRQMKNIIKRATLLAQGDFITKQELNLSNEFNVQGNTDINIDLRLHDETSEKERILQALQTANHNKSKAAILLGIDRKTLYNKLKLYNIPQS